MTKKSMFLIAFGTLCSSGFAQADRGVFKCTDLYPGLDGSRREFGLEFSDEVDGADARVSKFIDVTLNGETLRYNFSWWAAPVNGKRSLNYGSYQQRGLLFVPTSFLDRDGDKSVNFMNLKSDCVLQAPAG